MLESLLLANELLDNTSTVLWAAVTAEQNLSQRTCQIIAQLCRSRNMTFSYQRVHDPPWLSHGFTIHDGCHMDSGLSNFKA